LDIFCSLSTYHQWSFLGGDKWEKVKIKANVQKKVGEYWVNTDIGTPEHTIEVGAPDVELTIPEDLFARGDDTYGDPDSTHFIATGTPGPGTYKFYSSAGIFDGKGDRSFDKNEITVAEGGTGCVMPFRATTPGKDIDVRVEYYSAFDCDGVTVVGVEIEGHDVEENVAAGQDITFTASPAGPPPGTLLWSITGEENIDYKITGGSINKHCIKLKFLTTGTKYVDVDYTYTGVEPNMTVSSTRKDGETNNYIPDPAVLEVWNVDYINVLPNPVYCSPDEEVVFTGYAYNKGTDGERYYNCYGTPNPGLPDDDKPLYAVYDWSTDPGSLGTVNPELDSASTTFTASGNTYHGIITATYNKQGEGNDVSGSATVNVCSIDGVEPNMGGIPIMSEDEIDFDVTIEGTFSTSISAVDFGSGIRINHFTRDNDTQITANIRIYSSASPGYRDVSVTCDGVECTGEDMFLVVRNIIEYSWNPVQLGAKETILYADGIRTTTVTSYVKRDNNIPVEDVEVTFSIEEGNGSVNPETAVTDDSGKATSTLTSANGTGKTIVKAAAATSGISKTVVYMYRHKVGNPDIYYDFNEIISNNDMTNTPTNLDTQEEIQAWLEGKESGLASIRYEGMLVSQIIHNACQENDINVQVILVTLQKEQGLISKKNPTQAQLNHAMGYGSSSNIKHQVEAGAACFKNHYNAAPDMPYLFPKGTPGGTGIGYYTAEDNERVGVRVRICNRATYALYKYTPWIQYTNGSGGNALFYDLWDQYGF